MTDPWLSVDAALASKHDLEGRWLFPVSETHWAEVFRQADALQVSFNRRAE